MTRVVKIPVANPGRGNAPPGSIDVSSSLNSLRLFAHAPA